MAKSNKPIVWGPFAAGGTLTALLTPVLIVLTLLVALGHTPPALTYDAVRAVLSPVIVKVLIFGVVALSLWSAAHRLRITFYDFGARCDALVATLVYVAAACGTVAAALFLLRI